MNFCFRMIGDRESWLLGSEAGVDAPFDGLRVAVREEEGWLIVPMRPLAGL